MPTTTKPGFAPDYAVPPGDTLADILEERDMTQTELARRLGVSLKHVNQVVKGVAPISPDLALRLEKVLGSTAAFWLTREAQYQAKLAKENERIDLESAVDWAMRFPIPELKKLDLIPPGASGTDVAIHLLRFLGIARPGQWTDPTVAYRKSQHFESDPYALSAWLRRGEIEASAIDCAPYDQDRFLDALQEVRRLTRLDPAEWQPRLIRLCADAGVAVVIVDTFSRARANGATRWLSPNKALIQLSLRYKWEDVFWFTFFHEAGHVVQHRKKDAFVEAGPGAKGDDTDPGMQRLEDEANRFAARTLIPPRAERRLPQLSLAEIPAFAKELDIAPAIVVGRMHHEGLLPWNRGHNLRRQLVFVDDE